MAITYHGGNIIRGTAADRTGGTWTNLQAGYLFIESDTQLIYYWTGSTWTAISGGGGGGGSTGATVENMTGAKTFFDQKLLYRNPANTKSITTFNPPIVQDLSLTYPIHATPYKYIIGKYGSGGTLTYYSMKYDGSILLSDNTSHPEIVIQGTIDQVESEGGGTIYIIGYGQGSSADQYVLSSTWAGFTIGNNTGGTTADVQHLHVVCAPDTSFKIPNAFAPGTPVGSTGVFCTFTNATLRNGWSGGVLGQSTPNNAWIGFELYANSQASCQENTIYGVRINNCDIGIKLTSASIDGYVGDNHFEHLHIFSPNIGILFNQAFAYQPAGNSINFNNFDNINLEMNNRAAGTNGVKDVVGRMNSFYMVKINDADSAAVSCNITADSHNTSIFAGDLCSRNFVDLGVGTTISGSDQWSPVRLGRGVSYVDIAKTGNYTASAIEDHIIRVDGTSSAFTITLPSASTLPYRGSKFVIKRTDTAASSNTITIATTSSQTIDGVTTQSLYPGTSITVESDGANWQILNRLSMYPKALDSNNDTLYLKTKINAALVEVAVFP